MPRVFSRGGKGPLVMAELPRWASWHLSFLHLGVSLSLLSNSQMTQNRMFWSFRELSLFLNPPIGGMQ